VITQYLKSRGSRKSVNQATHHALKIKSHFLHGKNHIDGIAEGGAFGFEANLEHLKTGKTFTRTVDHCEYLPFYYSITTKAGQNEAVLILQRFGIYGIKSNLQDDLEDYFNDAYPDYRLSISAIVPEEYIKDVVAGGIKSITCIKYSVPQDIADDLGFEDHVENGATLELSIKAKKDGELEIAKWMRSLGEDWNQRGRMVEINGIEYNDVKLKVKVGNKTKTVQLSELDKIKMAIDVSDEIQLGSNGHPILESIRKSATEITQTVTKAIGWHS
jgi:hypothetical protein